MTLDAKPHLKRDDPCCIQFPDTDRTISGSVILASENGRSLAVALDETPFPELPVAGLHHPEFGWVVMLLFDGERWEEMASGTVVTVRMPSVS